MCSVFHRGARSQLQLVVARVLSFSSRFQDRERERERESGERAVLGFPVSPAICINSTTLEADLRKKRPVSRTKRTGDLIISTKVARPFVFFLVVYRVLYASSRRAVYILPCNFHALGEAGMLSARSNHPGLAPLERECQ